MPCFHPITALRCTESGYSLGLRTPGDKRLFFVGKKITDNVTDTLSAVQRSLVASGHLEVLEIPCGKCIGCRLEYSRQWALRCVHEATLHEDSCFLTLTYDPDLPSYSPSLNKDDITLFLKKLRQRLVDNHDREFAHVSNPPPAPRIRFFQCGEYGDRNLHPHHHVLLFGYKFPDRIKCVTSKGYIYYRSAELESLWKHGFSSIGDLTFESACYVTRYVLKKLDGDMVSFYTKRGLMPPYVTMSRRPGIGSTFFRKFESDFYPKDFITFSDGRKLKPPKYYDRLFEKFHGEDSLLPIKERRMRYVHTPEAEVERSMSRLSIKEQSAKFKLMNKKRSVDSYGNFSADL